MLQFKNMKRPIKKKVYKYTAVFEYNKGGVYTVTVPALPGLVTEGRGLKEAKFMAKDAIKGYLESLEADKEKIPEEKLSSKYPLIFKEQIRIIL